MQRRELLNFDVNAGYPPDPALWRYLEGILSDGANPSSVHASGQRSKFLIEDAREEIKKILKAEKSRVIFTSGGSEANNLILNSVDPGSHIIISALEHVSLLEPAIKLRDSGRYELTIINPGADGRLLPHAFIEALKPNTRFVSLMFANNETGDQFPVSETAKLLKAQKKELIFHSDAVQLLGKASFDFEGSEIDSLSLSGHKIGSLQGVGALLVKDHVKVKPLILGGPQESKLRAGTENVPGIISFAYRLRKVHEGLSEAIENMSANRKLLLDLLVEAIPGVKLNSFTANLLPNTINIQIQGVRSDDLVVALDLQKILISSAAACSSGKPLPSHVLLACGLSESEAKSSIRISLPFDVKQDEVRYAATKIAEAVELMRKKQDISKEADRAG